MNWELVVFSAGQLLQSLFINCGFTDFNPTIDAHLSLFLFFYETVINSLSLAHKFVCAHTYLFTFSRGNTMKEITFSSLKSSLTNKYQNFKFMLTDILLEDCPLLKKKNTLSDFTSGYEIQSVKILQ